MKKVSHILLLILVTSIAAAQLSIDSLERKLASSKPDTNRVMLLSGLSIAYLPSDHKVAMKYAKDGLALARTLKFKKGEADCLRRSGIVLFQEGNYPEALDNFQQALRISEEINYSFGIGAGLGHIGNVYAEQGDHVKAQACYSRYLKIAQGNPNIFEQANAWGRMGESYLEQGYFDSASFALNQSYQLLTRLQNTPQLARIFNDLASLETKKGKNNEAMAFYRKGLSYAEVANNSNVLNDLYVGMAELYHQSGNNDSCIFYALKGFAAGKRNNYSKGMVSACKLLSEVYEPIDEHEAYKYQKMAIAINDSLFTTAKTAQVQNLFFLERQRQQEVEIAKRDYKNKLRLYFLLLGLFTFLLFAIILYRNNRGKQKANNLLQIQKQEVQLQRSNAEKALVELKSMQSQLIHSEKMASLGELTAGIAHEIQNPLNFVNNFSEVNKELLTEMNDEIAKGKYNEAATIAKNIIDNQEKINHHGKRAEAIVKGMLQHSRAGGGQKEPTDINALADEYLRLAYHGLRAKDKSFNAKFETDFDQSIEKINVVPQDIGRVILNLINNAFYSISEKQKQNPENYEPAVIVSTKKMDDKIEIRVKDNGNGIPQKVLDKIFQPFFTTKPTGQGTGLGLSLAYDIITRGHSGELKVENREQHGAVFIIILPVI